MKKRLRTLLATVLPYITRSDVLAASVVALVIIAVTFNTSSVIMQNYTLQREVRVAQQKADIAQAELDTQKLKNSYYTTDEYLEVAARKQLSAGLPGEKMIIVPRDVALAYVKDITVAEDSSTAKEPEQLSNFQKWLRFLGGKLD